MGARGAVAAILLPLLFAAPALATEQRAIGPWTLKWGAQSDGSAYCTVELSEGGRTAGLQIVKGRQRFFGLRNPVWKWTPRQPYQVKLSVDGDAVSWTGPAAAALPDTLVMSVGPDPDPIAALEAGRMLTLEVGGASIAYSLADFPPAAAALRQCLAEAG